MKTRLWLSLIMIVGLSAGFACAAVWSDGFESGDVSHWSPGWGGKPGSVVSSLNGGVLLPRSGNYMATTAIDPYGQTGTSLWQTFATPLSGYTLTAYMALSGDFSVFGAHATVRIGATASSGSFVSVTIKPGPTDPNNPVPTYGIVHYTTDHSQDSWGAPEFPEGTPITVQPGEWLRVDLYGGPEGMIMVVGGRYVVRNPYVGGGWDAGHDIEYVWFGGSWGVVPGGYDDFIVTPGLPDAAPISCEVAIERGYGFATDLNADCQVSLIDVALFAQKWLDCVDPLDPQCLSPWD